MTKKIVVADASPLIAFSRINHLEVLSKTLGEIIITEKVEKECLEDMSRPGATALQKAILKNIITVHDDPNTDQYRELADILDEGEASAIALALKMRTSLLIDEKLGRAAAKKLNLKIIGTAGVLLLAKQNKIIDKVSPLIHKLKDLGYYLSSELITEILTRADEIPMKI